MSRLIIWGAEKSPNILLLEHSNTYRQGEPCV